VTVDGKAVSLRLSRMGGENLVGFSKANRAAAGIELGDEVPFDITADLTPRTVEVSDDLATALSADSQVERAVAALAYSHRKEFVRWVAEAKRKQTRADRVAKTVEMVRAGQTC